MKVTLGNFKRILRYGFGLKCPRCGEGALFQKRFKMFSHCPQCGLKFEREQGYFVGAMYLNYGATVFITFPGYFVLEVFTAIPFLINLAVWGAISAIFPVFFYPYSRSLWLNFDYLLNPKCD